MAKPTALYTWATDTNYSGGPAVGTPPRVAPTAGAGSQQTQGLRPDDQLGAQLLGALFGNLFDWAGYVNSNEIDGSLQVDGSVSVVGSTLTIASATFTASTTTSALTVTAHGLQTGDGPVRVSNSGGGLPGGLLAATDYWVIVTGVNTFQLALSAGNALAGVFIRLTSNGTGTNSAVGTGSTRRLGNLTVVGKLTQAVQTTVLQHTPTGVSTGTCTITVPSGTGSGHGHFVQVENVVGRTLVGIRAYVTDDGGTARLLIGVALNDVTAGGGIGSPPAESIVDVASTQSSTSAGTGVLEYLQKTGLSVSFVEGLTYYVYCRISAGTGGRLHRLEYDWI